MEYSDETAKHSIYSDQILINFFNKTNNLQFSYYDLKFQEKEKVLQNSFEERKTHIEAELNQFKFDKVFKLIFEIINVVNSYLAYEKPNGNLVMTIHKWLNDLLIKLGFCYNSNNSLSKDKEIMSVLIQTRDELRSFARDKALSKEHKQKIFKVLDDQRNHKLSNVGIVLEDTKDTSLWYYLRDGNT